MKKLRNADLLHDSVKNSRSLGCSACSYLKTCGGLHTERNLFDCSQLCRCSEDDLKTCMRACPNNIDMLVARTNEVNGFDLNISANNLLDVPALPSYVPIIKDGSSRDLPLEWNWVSLRLDKLAGKNWPKRLESRRSISDYFKVREDVNLVINSIGYDQPLERFWHSKDRSEIMAAISELRPALMTTPNFSLFTNVPRHENLYNMKRIAILWDEFTQANIPTAVHLNARTDRDWQRWRQFLDAHPEIKMVAFEFATGAGGKRRRDWYVRQLLRLGEESISGLSLVIRGGVDSLSRLSSAFDQVSLLSMTPYIKTLKRRQLRCVFEKRLLDRRFPTPKGQPLDALFESNVKVENQFVRSKLLPEQTFLDFQSPRQIVPVSKGLAK